MMSIMYEPPQYGGHVLQSEEVVDDEHWERDVFEFSNGDELSKMIWMVCIKMMAIHGFWIQMN